MSTRCDAIVRWGLAALIVFTPLAFGTVEAWAIALMEWGIVTLLLVFTLGRLWPEATPDQQPLRLTGLEVPFALFLLFCLVQTVPLPRTVLNRISPGAAQLYAPPEMGDYAALVAPRPGIAAEPLDGILGREDDGGPRPISVDADETLVRTRMVAVFMALFLLVAWWADRGQRILFLLTTIAGVGFLIAVEGLVQFLTWNGKIHWFRNTSNDSAFGPFVNHNHFAGYVEMVIPVAISLAIYLFESRGHPPKPNGEGPGAGIRFVEEQDRRGSMSKGALALFAVIILVVSLFFCMSRGGILSALLSGLILLVFLWRRIASRVLAWSIAVMLPIIIAAMIAWVGADVLRQQFDSTEVQREASFRARALVWVSMVRHFDQYLWVGSGLGGYEESFARYTPPGATSRWNRAHNDYLELLWEVGLIGGGLFIFACMIFLRCYWWPALRGRRHPFDLFRIGIAVALMSIAIHSLVDFNLQIGSNGFLFAMLAGLLVALHRVVEAPSAGIGPGNMA